MSVGNWQALVASTTSHNSLSVEKMASQEEFLFALLHTQKKCDYCHHVEASIWNNDQLEVVATGYASKHPSTAVAMCERPYSKQCFAKSCCNRLLELAVSCERVLKHEMRTMKKWECHPQHKCDFVGCISWPLIIYWYPSYKRMKSVSVSSGGWGGYTMECIREQWWAHQLLVSSTLSGHDCKYAMERDSKNA